MAEQKFYIDIENSAGVKYGSGPLTSAAGWEYTARMDRAGSFSFTVPATDPQAAELQRKRVVRGWALVGGVWTEVGAGIIDSIVRQPQADGTVRLEVSGDDLIRELSYRSVKDLKLYSGGNPVTHSAAVTAVAAYAPTGWTITADASPPNDSVYGRFNGETVLAALIKIADKTQDHFYRGSGRAVSFASSFTASGVRAIQAGPGDLVAETCAIVDLTETIETYDLITRIYPRGSGNGDVQLTLRPTSRSAGAGFTLSTTDNYIENDTAEATYGLIEQVVEYREIGPIANTAADLQAAADMLFDAALEELTRRSTEAESAYYDLTLAGCSALLRPLQSLRVVYRDVSAGIDVDETLNILEATWSVGPDGVQTTAVQVTTADRWPQSDGGAVADSIAQGRIYQAHPQLNANSYVTAYRGNVDDAETATFRFRFGGEVVQLQQVLFEFQLLPFESTVRSVGAASASTSAGGSATPTSSSGGSSTPTTSSGGSSTPTSSSGGASTPSSSSGGGSTPTSSAETSHTHTVTIANHTHSVTIANHTHSVTIAAHDHTVTIAAHTHTVTIASHAHDVHVYNTSDFTPITLETLYYAQAEDVFFSNSGAGGGSTTTESGGGSTPTSSSGGGSVPTTSSGGASTPSSSSGGGSTPTTSSGGSSTPTSSAGSSHSHTVTVPNHTHSVTIAAHDHTVTIAAHTHTVTIAAHTHTVTIADHTHSVTPSITTVYGIFRETSANTLTLNNLQYQINSGGWASVADSSDAGDGWLQLDLSADVVDATTLRPVQTNNSLEIRNGMVITSLTIKDVDDRNHCVTQLPHGLAVNDAVTISETTLYNGTFTVIYIFSATEFGFDCPTGVSEESSGFLTIDKTVTIDAQLSVRNIIQAIAIA